MEAAAPRVAVVGAGIAGAACAVALRSAGVRVDVVERGLALGGRMASPALHGRPVDLGAAYFTARDPGFSAVVGDWSARGLARRWTSELAVLAGDGQSTAGGTQRWAAGDGLRSLVRDLLPSDIVTLGREVRSLDELDHDAVVLAMPDPQAACLLGDAITWVDYEPVIAVAAGFARPGWALDSAAFINDDPDLTLIADDGARRGDDAPVLVMHTTAELARQHLGAATGAVYPTLAAARRLLAIDDEPEWTHAHAWPVAKPAGTHGGDPFGLIQYRGRLVAVAGDSWCPEGAPRIESAWLSGTRLAHDLACRLAGSGQATPGSGGGRLA